MKIFLIPLIKFRELEAIKDSNRAGGEWWHKSWCMVYLNALCAALMTAAETPLCFQIGNTEHNYLIKHPESHTES